MRTTAVRALLLAAIALLAWPVRWYRLTAGLDPSWAFAVNDAHTRGLIFGRDVYFTYGPLAWLTLPIGPSDYVWQGIAFQVLCWLAFTGVVGLFLFRRRIALWRLLVFTVCLLIGRPTFHYYDYVGPELFLAFLGLLLVGAAAVEKEMVQVVPCRILDRRRRTTLREVHRRDNGVGCGRPLHGRRIFVRSPEGVPVGCYDGNRGAATVCYQLSGVLPFRNGPLALRAFRL